MQSDQLQEFQEEPAPTIIAVRTHFAVSSASQAEKALPVSLRNKIAQQAEEIILPHRPDSLPVTLKRKQIQKPLHLLKLRKRINKQTKEISHLIESCTVIKTSYEHQDLCDFISSEGASLLKSKDPYKIDRDQLLSLVKQQYQTRIQSRSQGLKIEHNQDLWKLIKPANYLKSYNLTPPKCDFFVNRVKHADDRQLGSYSISYEDPLPSSSLEIPQNLKENELFKAVSGFLQKRPCWLKNVLLVTLKQQGLWGKFGANELKAVLRYVCYTFRNGPWKHTFCLFGFDPRINYKAVIYQNVSLKLKKKQAQDYEAEVEQQLYDPTFTEFSAKYIRGYQLGDIAIESIQQMLRGKLISGEQECTKQHGWLSASEHAQILKVMRQHKQSLQNSNV